MSRTNVDIDEDACRVVMERYRLATKRDAINFALRTVAGEPLGLAEARRLGGGSAWDGVGRRPGRDDDVARPVILVDTSAWVEFLRDTGSAVCDRVDGLLDDDVATCHPIRMGGSSPGRGTSNTSTASAACSRERR